ncbi:HD-GYP domain-containing protein [Polynucleobacter rarus]|uniref:HD-GYP domain-containing protein n=1 Tax=Polynucleobacter rarus TaxID=556055 RepID=UPI000D3E2EF7|nr:HD domain-containing phosphohydrolase [Polynucleobacter rarus]
MKSLSVASLFFTYALLHGFLGLLLVAFLRKNKNTSLKFLAYACFVQAALYSTLVLRPVIPEWIGITVPNFLSVAQIYLLFKAINTQALNKTNLKALFLVLAALYAGATSILSDSPFKEFTPLLVGAFLGAGNLFIAKELKLIQKNSSSLFIKIPFILSVLIAVLWVARGLVSYKLEIVLAQDQNIFNIVFFAVILMFVFIRKISWVGFYLDNSIHYQKRLEKYNSDLLALVEEVNEVEGVAQSLENGMLNVLNQLAKERDNETGNHILRTQLFVRLIASHLDDIGKSEVNYTKETLNILFKAAPLHDIGKVGIPDAVLLKPGKLNPAEWEIMKTHAVIGERILSSMNVDGEINSKIIKVAIEIAGSHHENWDGTGYPRGLSGKDIPQSARIMALADVYDALLSSRPYKKAWTYKATSEYINSLRGTKFDPDIVDAFNYLEAQFRLIRRQFKED